MWVMKLFAVFGIVLLFNYTSGFEDVAGDDAGKPLMLTPYIKQGHIQKARKLSRNTPLLDKVESYSGFLTVNATTDSHMFFWYFPAEKNRHSAPLLVWLDGGPGTPGVLSVLTFHGPYHLKLDMTVERRKYAWTEELNVLYIDNPVGVGYSYTGKKNYPTSQVQVGESLYEVVRQFLILFKELEKRPLYVAGHSFGGKFSTTLAHTIHTKNKLGAKHINLQGVGIGNGWVDPVNQLGHGPYMYNLGIIDDHQLAVFDKYSHRMHKFINAGNWWNATEDFYRIFVSENKLFTNITGLRNYFNFLIDSEYLEPVNYSGYLDQPHIRKSLHVGNMKFDLASSKNMSANLHVDFMQSVRPWLEELSENINVLIYNGQLDVIVGYPLTINYVKKMKWSGEHKYKSAHRKIWRIDDHIAGYTKTVYHNHNNKKLHFTEMLVRNAGHAVPLDQPQWGFEMIKRFTTMKEPF